MQVLYSGLRHLRQYDVVVLQVFDQDDSYHFVAVDHGVLQDASRERLSESHFADSLARPRTRVMYPTPDTAAHRGRGPGGGKRPRTVVWVPVLRGGKPIGAVVYQCDERREVTSEETEFLESVHERLGEIVVAASLPYLAGNERFSTSDRTGVLSALASCVTEADIVQVLYGSLRPLLGYDVVALQVLEREGWSHAVAVDHGVLQDVMRAPLANTVFAHNYDRPATTVIHPDPGDLAQASRGPGGHKRPQTVIWVPILQRGEKLGSVTYQADELRQVSPEERTFLEELSSHMGAVVSAAYLNELTRNQAVRLTALNAIARSLATTHDENGIVGALHSAIAPLLDCDLVELVVPEALPDGRWRVRQAGGGGSAGGSQEPGLRHAITHAVLRTGQSRLRAGPVDGSEHAAAVWVPVHENNRVRAVLSIHSRKPGAYEQSTVAFMEQVADEVALALRNAWAYAHVEAHGRRLEVVDAVGRRLASIQDRWSIMRTVRDELAAHLQFDFFSVATIAETDEGPVAEGYVFDGGVEQPLVAVALAEAGPSREAYETGRPVLIRESRWAGSFTGNRHTAGGLVYGDGALLQPTRRGLWSRAAARSIVWVPIRHGEGVRALLSLQSYEPEVFDEWHVALLKDVAAHVSLALATAEQVEARDRQARMMEAILTHSPIGMVLEDAAGNVLYANAEVERIYGKEAAGMIGRPAGHLLLEAGANLLSNPEAEPDGALQYGLARKEMVIEVRRVPVRGAGRHRAGALSLHEDVTRQRSLLEAKDLMLRAIGHEVRSPAAAMRQTLASLLQWGPVIGSEQGQVLVQEAYEQSDRLLRLVESQLIIAKLETPGFETRPVAVALGSALDQVLRILHSRYGQRAAVVRCSLPADLPDASCEPAHLDQVLSNLLGNALEYTKATQVQVSGLLRGDWLEVTVQDNGGGLPVSVRDTLFAKAGAGQSRARGGLGLGLYLCRLVVERSFGGRIWLSQTGPAGTSFKFTVPAAG